MLSKLGWPKLWIILYYIKANSKNNLQPRLCANTVTCHQVLNGTTNPFLHPRKKCSKTQFESKSYFSSFLQQGLFLINNKISKIHPKAFRNMDHLRLLYLSYNLLTEIPANLPPNVIELRFHENKINRIQKDAFKGLRKLHVLGKTWF